MDDTDQKLMDEFGSQAIPRERWDQRTHVAIAYIYLSQHGFARALELLIQRIKAFNAAKGIEESPTSATMRPQPWRS